MQKTYLDNRDFTVKNKSLLSKLRFYFQGKVYIRNYEGNFDISNNIPLIANIHNKKRKIFDEDMIYPYVSIEEDLRHDLIDKARKLANSNVKKRHLWMDLTDKDLLKSAGLYKTDKINGKEGVTLAGVMIFGKDSVIRDVNPYCRTDSLYRVDDLDRYDDRDFVETNLIEMYDRLIDFIAKYTMDRFALDENARITITSFISTSATIDIHTFKYIINKISSFILLYVVSVPIERLNEFLIIPKLGNMNFSSSSKNALFQSN